MQNRLLKPLLLAIAPFLASSCSSILAEGGTKLEAVFQRTSTRSSIQKVLGQPVATVAFRPAKTARQSPGLANQYKLRKTADAGSMMLSGYEEFRFKGWVYHPSDANGGIFIDVITLGAGGIIGTPGYILLQKSRSHEYRVYYDSSGHYFGHLVIGDSRHPDMRPAFSLRGDSYLNL